MEYSGRKKRSNLNMFPETFLLGDISRNLKSFAGLFEIHYNCFEVFDILFVYGARGF